jgi:hypothetical protein
MAKMRNFASFISVIVCLTNLYILIRHQCIYNTSLLLQDTNSFGIASHKALHSELQWQ